MEDIEDRLALKGQRRKQLDATRVKAKKQLSDEQYVEALGLVLPYMTNAELELDRITEDSSDVEVRNVLSNMDSWERQAAELIGADA
ncbi:MAG: hypothetical protein H7338_02490 [Candidatus Sericytochromatia bacterium]|nr:hypothetical protein [Candidatus Sericytochromatia bacterium]